LSRGTVLYYESIGLLSKAKDAGNYGNTARPIQPACGNLSLPQLGLPLAEFRTILHRPPAISRDSRTPPDPV